MQKLSLGSVEIGQQLFWFMLTVLVGDDVEVDVGGFGHEALDGEEVEIFAEAVEG